jgi:hypothetical protein
MAIRKVCNIGASWVFGECRCHVTRPAKMGNSIRCRFEQDMSRV